MIARMWRGVVRREHADEYTAYINETGIAEYTRTPGNRGADARYPSRMTTNHDQFLSRAAVTMKESAIRRMGTVLAQGVSEETLKLKARGRTDVVVRTITIAPGGSTGWHHHPGQLLAVV